MTLPSTEKAEKSALIGVVDAFLDSKRQDGDEGEENFLNIIDFVDRFKLLPDGLFPVQKFILKLYYGIPLDDFLPASEKDRIKLTDKFNTKVLCEFTEVEYLEFLHEQGRCNIGKQDFSRPRRELVLVLGRRSGKSMLSAIISAYELYKLLCRGNPQSYYGLPSSSEIRVLCVANDKEQASIVYGDIAGFVDQVDFFSSSIVNDTQTFMRFQTDEDRRRYGKGSRSTITATFKSSIAKGLRGRGIICYILDELAFFVNDGKTSAEQVYRAINPSLAQFSPKNPVNKRMATGPSEGRAISISSPDTRSGFFYKLYQRSMEGGKQSRNMLMIQAPTWEVNPTLSSDYYEVEFSKDPKAFVTEFGAEFSDRVRTWIEDPADLTDCVVEDHKPLARGNPRESFFAGLDFAVVGDGSAIVLFRLIDGKVELAYHEAWYAGKKWADVNPHLTVPLVPYAMKLQDMDRLDIMEIAEWIRVLSTRFYIEKGVFDQWAGPIFENELHKRNLRQFESRHFSTADSSYAYHTAKMFMYSRQLALYDYPVPPKDPSSSVQRHSPLIEEMLDLQATSGGKNITIVEAPKVSGAHDDLSDAFVRGLLMVSEYMKIHPGALEMSKSLQMPRRPMQSPLSYRHYQQTKARLHGVSDRARALAMSRRR